MISTEKVSLMTRCAIYEKNESKDEIKLTGYFKRDYVQLNILRTLVAAFFAYVIGLGLYVGAFYEEIFSKLNQMQYKDLLINAGLVLLIVMVVYYVIARVFYAARFSKVKKSVIVYYRNLKKLQSLQNAEDVADSKYTGGESAQNDEFIDY